MSTTEQLFANRESAGARYRAAVLELRAAFGDLAAVEKLLAQSHHAPPTFGPPPDLISLRHPTYAADISGSFSDDIAAAFRNRAS
jgi:hypothetical protein